ncbi:RibD family protein [Actinoalloteichus spitiensis]|uniref:RibD family protein n=1 Tax=Actinoalloteichus spitiensis TaxID=252394 RepID=UPI00036FED21|nr:dihydrofolate reductase family protein [Actinoalloteichus spitiensis]
MADDRPHVLVSCAMSVDGYIDDASPHRLLLSGEADFDRVDEVRAGCDAILVGANTIRRDDPRLLVRSEERRRARVARGVPPSPTKVTVTTSGALDPGAAFFTEGTAEKLVYAPHQAARSLDEGVGARAVVVDAGPRVDLAWVLTDLAGRGVRRLLVEGGTAIHTWFLTAGLVDELHVVVAPFFVGDSRAPRLVGDGEFPWTSGRRMTLVDARPVGDVVLLRYRLPS